MFTVVLSRRTAMRILLSTWLAVSAVFRLGFRLLWNGITHSPTDRGKIIGQTVVEVLQSLGPTYVKLGQILSTRPDLFNKEVIRELSQLQDRLPPAPFEFVVATFRKELGTGLHEVFSEFESKPVSSASVASVYRARLQNGRRVAVKVLRPNIARLIREDRKVLLFLARVLERIPPLRRIPLSSAIHEFGACLERQTDFRLEAAANRRLRSALIQEPQILIPALIEGLCSHSIITMEYIEGFHDPMPEESAELREATCAALRALYRMIFVEGFVHCDLHWGNLHFLNGGRVGMVDFGFMAELCAAERVKFAEFFYGLATRDGRRCANTVLETAFFLPPGLDRTLFEMSVNLLIDEVSGANVGHFQVSTFVTELFRIQRDFRIVGTTAFTMAIVSLLVFEGIAKVAYPDLDFQREAMPFVFHIAIHGSGPARFSRVAVNWRTGQAKKSRNESPPLVLPRVLK